MDYKTKSTYCVAVYSESLLTPVVDGSEAWGD